MYSYVKLCLNLGKNSLAMISNSTPTSPTSIMFNPTGHNICYFPFLFLIPPSSSICLAHLTLHRYSVQPLSHLCPTSVPPLYHLLACSSSNVPTSTPTTFGFQSMYMYNQFSAFISRTPRRLAPDM